MSFDCDLNLATSSWPMRLIFQTACWCDRSSPKQLKRMVADCLEVVKVRGTGVAIRELRSRSVPGTVSSLSDAN